MGSFDRFDVIVVTRAADEVDQRNCRQDKFEKASPGVAPSLKELLSTLFIV